MKTLKIKPELIKKAIEILTVTIGEESFEVTEEKEMSYTIDSFEDIMRINETTSKPTFSEFSNEKDRDYHLADWEWEEIAKAYNKKSNPKYVADYLNANQKKYYAVAILKKDDTQPSGFSFSDSAYDCTHANAHVGVRHAFENSNDVMDALKKFPQIYIRMRTK